MRWHKPVIQQSGGRERKMTANLRQVYITSTRPARATVRTCLKKRKKQGKRRREGRREGRRDKGVTDERQFLEHW